jgi:hypothetical protein
VPRVVVSPDLNASLKSARIFSYSVIIVYCNKLPQSVAGLQINLPICQAYTTVHVRA